MTAPRHLGLMPYLDPSAGGIHSYSLSVLEALRGEDPARVGFGCTLVAPWGRAREVRSHLDPSWPRIGPDGRSIARRVVDRLRRRVHVDATIPAEIPRRTELSRHYREAGIDLMLYTTVQPVHAAAFEVDLPYVVAIHDVQHRLQPEISGTPEERELLEYYTRNCARFATMILVDSETGKEDVLRLYGADGVTPDRVRVLPFCLPPALRGVDWKGAEGRARAHYALPARYLFYPAQFWPHKNHLRIIEALGALKARHGLAIPLVLCGFAGDQYTAPVLQEVMARAEALGVRDQVRYLGFAPVELMPGLYAGAAALLMPTFYGPTNIPVLEAWAAGCPVLTSRIRGIVEQVGDAGALVDPNAVEEMVEGIRRLWQDAAYSTGLVARGRDRLGQLSPAIFRDRLRGSLQEAMQLAVPTARSASP